MREILFKKGDEVQAVYTDALSKTMVLRGVIDRFDPDLDKYWVELPIGVSLPFTEEKLTKL